MISTTMCCQWVLLCIGAVLVLPAIHLASAGIVRQKSTSMGRKGQRQQSSSPSQSSSESPQSSSSSSVHGATDQFVTAENKTPTAWPSSLVRDSEVELPEGFKFVIMDEENTPFIIIPNMMHLMENDNDLLNALKSAVKDAHRSKRSTSASSSSSSRQCFFNYQVTVRRTGRCTRFGNIPACISGEQLYPYARDC